MPLKMSRIQPKSAEDKNPVCVCVCVNLYQENTCIVAQIVASVSILNFPPLSFLIRGLYFHRVGDISELRDMYATFTHSHFNF